MLDKIASNKWLNAAAAAGFTILAVGLWMDNGSLFWKVFVSLGAIFLLNDVYKMFKKDK